MNIYLTFGYNFLNEGKADSSLKGYQKRVIYLKNTGSHIFDEAYFVVSREGEGALTKSDMVLEANRIIEESLNEGAVEKRRRSGALSFLLPFFLGALMSVAIFAVVSILI